MGYMIIMRSQYYQIINLHTVLHPRTYYSGDHNIDRTAVPKRQVAIRA